MNYYQEDNLKFKISYLATIQTLRRKTAEFNFEIRLYVTPTAENFYILFRYINVHSGF